MTSATTRPDPQARFDALRDLFARGPLHVEPLAAILPASDMRKLNAMIETGALMRCPESGRVFDPRLCRAA